jgi:glycerol-3-phosphate acyltransferase PlsX
MVVLSKKAADEQIFWQKVLDSAKEGAVVEGVIKSLYSKYDYHEYGGAPLLGVNGVSLISHGSSKDRTIKNAILRGKAFANARINEKIVARLATVKMEQVEA